MTVIKLKFSKTSKGLSTIFISVYVAILSTILISILLLGVEISASSLAENSRIEQERMQEKIVLAGPNALQVSGSIVEKIRVNNTGSITTRIRGFYIDHKFICDPSKFAGDSYIKPKESIWIQLTGNVFPPVELNEATLNSDWTITSERGARASEIGVKLLWGEPGTPYTPNKFYYGPLMLVFDMFHWRSGAGTWNDGWNITTGIHDVTWRILLANIDERPINVYDRSTFTLLPNDKVDSKSWYIDPTLGPITFEPGVYHFVYFTWNQPFDPSGPNHAQDMVGFGSGTNCINFLTFVGEFEEADSSKTPFGQTIPFEAVLVN